MDNTPENNLSSFECTSSALVANNNLHKTLSGTLEAICEGFDHLYEYGNEDGYLESFPTGYRFLPSDEELICAYLLPKIADQALPRNRFHVVNMYLHSPEHLSELYQSQGDNWFFFTERYRKYAKGKRPNRAVTEGNGNIVGYWKATGPDKVVIRKKDGRSVGVRHALVYYKGKAPNGEKQPWIMHEYIAKNRSIEPNGKNWKLDDCVLCKIYRKSGRNYRGNNDKGKARAQDQTHNDKGKARAQDQTHQVGNEEQALLRSDSPGSSKSSVMEPDNANNNFQAYNFTNLEYVNGYLPLPTNYYPYHHNTDMLLPIPGVLYGNNNNNNNNNNSTGSSEPMSVVEEQQQFQDTKLTSQYYDYGHHSSQQLSEDPDQVSEECIYGDQSLHQPSNDVNQLPYPSYEGGYPLYRQPNN